ncbi:conjugal transfer protein TraC [Allorhizobium sp. NPDC080224]|uniref:conjugal transfer protein TraC n=1 Tax=Allorhizobium sp. NPDC080224 TaxID=3390547 RepID=UPI003D00CF61
MKRPSSKIREEIAKLQDQLKQAETREAERIGRIALRAGLGEIEIDETALQVAFENIAKHFRGGQGATTRVATDKKDAGGGSIGASSTTVGTGAGQGSAGEA